jgi:hypothetical protein
MSHREIGMISNYYGGLCLKDEAGRLLWGIEDWDGIDWEEIPRYLYDALMQYQDERDASSYQIDWAVEDLSTTDTHVLYEVMKKYYSELENDK